LKGYEVILTEDAAGDLEGLQEYIAQHDAPSKADYVLDRIQHVIDTLATFPERGSYPKELLALGIREYRQAFFKPYRLIYRVIGQRVYVYLIADGRRDMQALLERRLLGA
jgi:toxin ParE1/3/4